MSNRTGGDSAFKIVFNDSKSHISAVLLFNLTCSRGGLDAWVCWCSVAMVLPEQPQEHTAYIAAFSYPG